MDAIDRLLVESCGGSLNLPSERQLQQEDISINPASICSADPFAPSPHTTPVKARPTPTITLDSGSSLARQLEERPQAKATDRTALYDQLYSAQSPPASRGPTPSQQFTFANTGLGMSTLGLFANSPSSFSNLGASYGSSSFMPGVGDLFDDFGLSSFTPLPLNPINEANPDDSSATIIADLLDDKPSAAEIQANRAAAAAQALGLPNFDYQPQQTEHTTRAAFDPSSYDIFGFTLPPQQQQQQQQQQQPASQMLQPPATPYQPQKSLRAVKSAGDLKSKRHRIDFATLPPPPPMPVLPPSLAPAARGRVVQRDVGPLDRPAQPDYAQPPASPSQRAQAPTMFRLPSQHPQQQQPQQQQIRSPSFAMQSPDPSGWQQPMQRFSSFDGLMPSPFIAAPANSPMSGAAANRQVSFTELYDCGMVQGGALDDFEMVWQGKAATPDPMSNGVWQQPAHMQQQQQQQQQQPNPFLALPSGRPAVAGSPCFSSPASEWSASPVLSPRNSHGSTGEPFNLEELMLQPSGSSNGSDLMAPFTEAFATLNGQLMSPRQPSSSSHQTQFSDIMMGASPSAVFHSDAQPPRSPLNSIPGFENVNMDFLSQDPVPSRRQSPIKTRSSSQNLRRKRSRQDLEEEDDDACSTATSDYGDQEYASDYGDADSDWAPQGGPSNGDIDLTVHHEAPGRGRSRQASQRLQPPQSPVVGRRLRPGPKPKGAKAQEVAELSSAPAQLHTMGGRPLQEHLQIAWAAAFPQGIPAEFQEVYAQPSGEAKNLPKAVLGYFFKTVNPASSGQTGGKKHVCKIEGCGRDFPRKSAIESHIQTHLDDKPFTCPHCSASFVRQHDLRRHERIHSGNKPFFCPCGKGFARGDALMRHRQRGICSGSTVPLRPDVKI